MESRVLPSKSVAPVLSEYFVCVKINIDKPPAAAEKLFEQVNGNTLPFYVYTTPDGTFISATSGYRDVDEFKGDLEGVLKHHSLRPSADQEKKLAAAADQAAKDLESKEFALVIKAWRDSNGVRGFSDSKKRLKSLADKAVEGGRARLQEAEGLVKAEKHAEAMALLKKLQTDFRGTDLDGPIKNAIDAIEAVKPSPGPDTVILKDGSKVNGKIVARSEQLVMVQVPGGKFVKIEKEKIADIQSDPKK
jgi:thioredoxin-like negative regulator of GroEL